MSIPRQFNDHGYRVASSVPTRRTVDLYDTGDRRLAAAGAELSFNRRDGWIWRRDNLGNPKLTVREWRAPASTPRQTLDEWSRAYRRGRPLASRASVCIHRRVHRLTSAGGQHAATLVEERVDEHRGELWLRRLRRVAVVEIDAAHESRVEAAFDDAVLDDAATLALLRPALARAPRLRLPEAAANGPRELFVRSITLSMIQWLYFDCELSATGSPDALRKLRVALRRLRSDVQTFAPLLDHEAAAALREELGGFAARLGVVRDAEVLSSRLGELQSMLDDADRESALPLIQTAAEQLLTARAQLLDELSGGEYIRLLDHAMAAVTGPAWSEQVDEIVSVTVLAAKPWRRLGKFVQTLDGIPDDQQLHRTRILAKRVRYAADACAPAVGESAARCAARVAELQTVLGEQHDAVVTRAWLHQQAGAGELAYTAGQLAALELSRLRDATRNWRDAWARASRSKDWRWLRS